MAYTEYPLDYYSADGQPIHAALLSEVVFGNLDALLMESPFGTGGRITNDETEPYETTATDFEDPASILFRSPPFPLRGRRNLPVKSMRVELRGSTDFAAEGTFLCYLQPSFGFAEEDPPPFPAVYGSTAAGAVTNPGGWHTIDIDNVGASQIAATHLGSAWEDRAPIAYYWTHLVIHGRVDSGGGAIRFSRWWIEEVP